MAPGPTHRLTTLIMPSALWIPALQLILISAVSGQIKIYRGDENTLLQEFTHALDSAFASTAITLSIAVCTFAGFEEWPRPQINIEGTPSNAIETISRGPPPPPPAGPRPLDFDHKKALVAAWVSVIQAWVQIAFQVLNAYHTGRTSR